MAELEYVYLKVSIDGEGNTALVGAWEDDPRVEPKGFGPVFPCRKYEGCYCILVGGVEVRVWCPNRSSSEEEGA